MPGLNGSGDATSAKYQNEISASGVMHSVTMLTSNNNKNRNNSSKRGTCLPSNL